MLYSKDNHKVYNEEMLLRAILTARGITVGTMAEAHAPCMPGRADSKTLLSLNTFLQQCENMPTLQCMERKLRKPLTTLTGYKRYNV